LGQKIFCEKKIIGPPKFVRIHNFVRLTRKNRKKNFCTAFFSKIFRFCWFSLTMALYPKNLSFWVWVLGFTQIF
jgi:hypothetical protein